MLPGVLAGLYSLTEATIDLQQLCAACDARLIAAAAVGLDAAGRIINLNDRPPIPFDVVSFAVGSIPRTAGGESCPGMISLKPLKDFPKRWEEAVRRLCSKSTTNVPGTSMAPLKVVVVGGGAAGCEITLALERWMNREAVASEIRLVESGREILSGSTARTVQRMRRELVRRGVQVETSLAVLGVRPDRGAGPPEAERVRLEVNQGDAWSADLVVWATGAAPPPWLSRLDLPLDDHGFLLVEPTLQTVSGRPVFAAGDVAGESPCQKREFMPSVRAICCGAICAGFLGASLCSRTVRAGSSH
jgi:selenide,water dikinase